MNLNKNHWVEEILILALFSQMNSMTPVKRDLIMDQLYLSWTQWVEMHLLRISCLNLHLIEKNSNKIFLSIIHPKKKAFFLIFKDQSKQFMNLNLWSSIKNKVWINTLKYKEKSYQNQLKSWKCKNKRYYKYFLSINQLIIERKMTLSEKY